MERNYEESLRRLLLSEGGYTHEATDPGGPTNFGITIFDAQMYAAEFKWKPAGYKITAADVRAMPRVFALSVYRRKYWDSQNCSHLPDGLDYTVFDYGVNSGIGRSAKVLQRVLGIKVDGKIGPVTLAAVARVPAKEIISEINLERMRFLQSLRIWPTYKNGWTRRVKEVNSTSLAWAAKPLEPRALPPAVKIPAPEPGMAKGTVGSSKGAQNTVAGAGAGATIGGALSFPGWIASHPWESGLMAVSGLILASAGVRAVRNWNAAKREAPAPGWKSPELVAKFG